MSSKRYNEELKKQSVNKYLKETSISKIASAYGAAKSTVRNWAVKYSDEYQYTKPQPNTNTAKEIRKLNKRIAELGKEAKELQGNLLNDMERFLSEKEHQHAIEVR